MLSEFEPEIIGTLTSRLHNLCKVNKKSCVAQLYDLFFFIILDFQGLYWNGKPFFAEDYVRENCESFSKKDIFIPVSR